MPDSLQYLAIAPQGLGDSLEATPFIAALKEARPDCRIDVAVTRPGPKELFEGLPQVDRVMYLPYWDKGAAAFVRAILAHRRHRRYDASFLMYPAARWEYQVLMRAFPSRRRYSHRYFEPTVRNMLWLSSDLVPIEKQHNVIQNFALLGAAGIEHRIPDRYSVPADWIAREEARRPNRIAVHVGTITHNGLGARRWPLERFEEVVRRSLNSGLEVWLVMGPSERDETLAVKTAFPQVEIVEGPLAQVARFLSTCSLVLTNDSGIGHLAAGVGAPVLSLFGPTAPWRHGPYGPRAVALRPSQCPPCFDPRLLNTECALNIGHRCLREDMPVEAVTAAMNAVLAEQQCRVL